MSGMKQKVYVIDGARTPFRKPRATGSVSGGDLAVACSRALVARQKLRPPRSMKSSSARPPSADEANIGRVVALRVGCGDKVPAWTVMRNCASGMQALDSACANILAGRSPMVLASGTDAMSHAPLLFGPAMVNWLADWYAAKSFRSTRGHGGEVSPGVSWPRSLRFSRAHRSDRQTLDGANCRNRGQTFRH